MHFDRWKKSMYRDIYSLYRAQKAGLISCIKVYAYAYEHGPKGKMVRSPYHQMLQEIIIQDAAIDIDKGIDIPAFQETVGCHVVMGGIKTDIPWEEPVSVTPEIINGIEEVPAVMPPCAGEVHQQWELNPELCIPGTEHIKGMPEIPAVIVAVPSPSRVRVGIMAPTAIAERAGALA